MRSSGSVLAVLCALLVVPLAARRGEDSPRSSVEPEAPVTSIGELRVEGSRWLGEEMRFTLQFDASVPEWNPWLTRFGQEDFIAFQAWADEQFLWNQTDFEDPAPRLFARRGSVAAKILQRARRHDRFRVHAVVRAVFLDAPWIEILSAERLGQTVSRGSILHAARALRLMESGSWSLATGELERAQLGRLPAHAHRELERLRTLCAER